MLQFREAAAKGKAIAAASSGAGDKEDAALKLTADSNEGLADLSRDLSQTWIEVRVAASQHSGVPIPEPLALDVPDHLGSSDRGGGGGGGGMTTASHQHHSLPGASCVTSAAAYEAAAEARRRHSLYAVCSSPLPYADVMRPMQLGVLFFFCLFDDSTCSNRFFFF